MKETLENKILKALYKEKKFLISEEDKDRLKSICLECIQEAEQRKIEEIIIDVEKLQRSKNIINKTKTLLSDESIWFGKGYVQAIEDVEKSLQTK